MLLAACQPAEVEEVAEEVEEEAEEVVEEAEEAMEEEDAFKVGLVTDVGEVDDKSFNQSAWEGVQMAADELGAEVDFIETGDAKDYGPNIDLFAQEGFDVIVTVGFALGEATLEKAAEYPDVHFIGVDQFQVEPVDNVAGLIFEEDKSGYMAGALAGLLTETNTVAAVLGTDLVPPVVAFKEGYETGVAYVNPDAEVISTFHPGGMDVAFTDPEWGATTAKQAIDNGADVVFGAGGKTGNGALIESAGYEDVYCIGVDTDQWLTVPEAHPCLVSSAMKLITPGVFDLIKLSNEGNFPSGNYVGDFGLAPFHDFEDEISQDVKDQLDEIRTMLLNDELDTGYPPEEEGEEEAAEPEEEMALGTEESPIKVLFVPSVDVDFMIESGDLIEQALNEATGLYFEVSVPTSYAATIEEMCASPRDTVGFIPAMGYALANNLCGVEPALASVRYGWNVYWTGFYVARDSEYETLADLEGATWAYPDAGSTSGYLYPSAIWDNQEITLAETIEAGGHPQAVRAVYNGEADVGTAYFSPPLLPEGNWEMGMNPDVPDEVVEECGLNEEGDLYCGDYRVLDARAAISEEAPDVVQEVRILALSDEIPNDTMSFSPDFPEDLKETITTAVVEYVDSEACAETLCNENFYDWTGAAPVYDENFDGVRLLMEAQGITLENIGE
jgi:basic membrane protein A